MSTTKTVTTEDGLRLAVEQHGDPSNPCVVCVHGYPDNRSVWDEVVTRLAESYHVVTYDVRGAGESERPAERDGYRLDRLVDDLAEVVNAVAPEKAVHLLAHDWGSIQSWHALTDQRLRTRIRSLTSISGPSLDHAASWVREQLRKPTPKRLGKLFRQLARSGYIGFFQLPVLPELAWRSGMLRKVLRGLDDSARYCSPRTSDAVAGLELYRENMSSRPRGTRLPRTEVPVQVLAPNRDAFVTAALQTEVRAHVSELFVRGLAGGHWIPRQRPEQVARCAAELVEHLENGTRKRELLRARVSDDDSGFEHRLVVVTGAGNGIGRATALAFAANGAEVVVTDVDEQAARRTAHQARAAGGTATAHALDVSDEAATYRLADRVREEHGVADIVVNNAGVGLAGKFSDTTGADWREVLGVNLLGVVHGCLAFTEQQIEHGQGGRIINISSAAAYLPVKGLSVYSTSKSAVLTLSERLDAELAEHGISVTAVCPGAVHTGITGTARFVGVDAARQRQRRETATRLYRLRGFGPEKAAAAVLRAAGHPAPVVPVTTEARIGLLLSRFAPGMLRAAARTGPKVR
ncbi:NAD(P)-dependent dehydrogenase (short-subunit alcohol dehydrogenase family)/pimeloyl-ACP methyl ester carboxylesterase [Actinopolyspora biskrensis]|uniref:NAD(P)-dependent dehydrogenase (Short-subunit alcohol dehydrogenase family)/pimeloyl-ACP methyl ester carboxylesterase n=1 Tax=Actinopolyspora biskrensis TaxID=1470178 RepID=A0A852Z9T6_9ACTN|nr:SDR family oxidoreductase [Actinopolyspora biskrensis]NYH79307.1 NAD(P)-dependent dehydrogenase (short-subunit alcohol dehydrogenase family)/pimeloyl-ACP methyl ester carboxylesterase [Actinopolyspora biskrensis]